MENLTNQVKIALMDKGYTEADMACMSANEVFEKVLEWEGIIGYAWKIKQFILDIYGIDLDEQ